MLHSHLPQDRHPVGARHPEIEDQDVRFVLADGTQRLDAVDTVIDDDDVGFALEQCLEPGQDNGVIVGDDDTDLTGAGPGARHESAYQARGDQTDGLRGVPPAVSELLTSERSLRRRPKQFQSIGRYSALYRREVFPRLWVTAGLQAGVDGVYGPSCSRRFGPGMWWKLKRLQGLVLRLHWNGLKGDGFLPVFASGREPLFALCGGSRFFCFPLPRDGVSAASRIGARPARTVLGDAYRAHGARTTLPVRPLSHVVIASGERVARFLRDPPLHLQLAGREDVRPERVGEAP